MAPKKDPKKEPQPPQEQQPPQIPAHELEGYGKFEYLDGTVYQGSWKLFDGIKMKHGQGTVTITGSSHSNLGAQSYEGSWEEDKMCGYGVYKYANGAFYRGDWKNNKHHGKGEYEFPNGTCYVGDWQNQLMHGAGYFIDENGHKWVGQFRKGKYESKQQKQLAKQRQLIVKKATMIKDIEALIVVMAEAVAKSDKKTLKDNFSPFFPSGDVIKEQVKDPYSKFDEKAPQKWTQILNILKDAKINPLASADESEYVGAERILKAQLEGPGQVVQVISNKDQRCVKAAFVNVEDKVWVLCNILDEEKKK